MAHLFSDVYSSFLAPLMPLIIFIHKLTLTQAGYIITIYAILASVMQPLFGFLSDKAGRKYFIVLSPLLVSIFMSSLICFDNLFIFIIVLLLAGMATSAFHPAGASLAHSLHETNPSFGLAWFIALGTIGTAIGPFYISWIASHIARNLCFIAAIPGLLFSIIFILYFKPPAMHLKPQKELIANKPLPYLLFSLLFSMSVLRAFAQYSLSSYLPVHLNREGYSLIATGATVSLIMGMASLGGLAGGYLYKKLSLKTIFIISNALSAICLALFLNMSGPLLFILLALGCFNLFMPGPISIAVAQEIRPASIGTISALMMGFGWGIGGMLVPVIGYLGDQHGLLYALSILFIAPALSVILSAFLPKKGLGTRDWGMEICK